MNKRMRYLSIYAEKLGLDLEAFYNICVTKHQIDLQGDIEKNRDLIKQYHDKAFLNGNAHIKININRHITVVLT